MSKVAIKGNASGTATFTIEAPVGVGTDRTLTLPDEAGTVLTSGTDVANFPSGFANGITMVDQYRLTTATNTSTNAVITSNIEQVDDALFTTIGSSMSVSSGVFTFPETGIYLVTLTAEVAVRGDNASGAYIEGTQDNSSFDILTSVLAGARGDEEIFSVHGSAVVDITNTSTHKVRFSSFSMAANCELVGDTTRNRTHFTFIRLGDT